MYMSYVKFQCLPQKREAFIREMKHTGVLEATDEGGAAIAD